VPILTVLPRLNVSQMLNVTMETNVLLMSVTILALSVLSAPLPTEQTALTVPGLQANVVQECVMQMELLQVQLTM
jgi:hypothetical protein